MPVQSGTWAIPSAPQFTEGIAKARGLCRDAGGSFTELTVTPRDDESLHTLTEAFVSARRDEWQEFLADCAKFETEIAKEISIRKFTYAELEEEDQSLERLRRWYRELKKRDVLDLDVARQAETALQACTRCLDDYAQLVYAAAHEADS